MATGCMHQNSLLRSRDKYTSKEFEDYLARKGTKHRLTMLDTPEQNGGTKQLNCTLVKRSRAMLIESNLPKSLWGYAIIHANYNKNCMHTCIQSSGQNTLQDGPW